MPIEIYWIDEPAILGIECSGNVNATDIVGVGAQCLPLVLDATQPFVCLVDFGTGTRFPTNLLPIVGSAPDLLKFINHPNLLWFAFVGSTLILRTAMQVFITQTQYANFKERESGFQFLLDKLRQPS